MTFIFKMMMPDNPKKISIDRRFSSFSVQWYTREEIKHWYYKENNIGAKNSKFRVKIKIINQWKKKNNRKCYEILVEKNKLIKK